MRRVVLTFAAGIIAATSVACGGGDVVVLAQLQEVAAGPEGAEGRPLASLPLYLLPYDRDAIFDSLSQAHPTPEPQVPDTVFALQDQVRDRYREWQTAERRWGLLRDSLQTMLNRMERMNPQSGEYFVMFREYNDLADEVEVLERRSTQAFEGFTSLQNRLQEEAREIQIQRELWADDAFAPVDSIIQARLEERRAQEHADTTSAHGVARFRGVSPGQWWIHGRYDRPFDELYWNIPIQVDRGEEIQVRLTEQNAEVRQKM
jgi:hypothetical protein